MSKFCIWVETLSVAFNKRCLELFAFKSHLIKNLTFKIIYETVARAKGLTR